MTGKLTLNGKDYILEFSETHKGWVEDFESMMEENLRVGEFEANLEVVILTYYAHVNYWLNGYEDNLAIREILLSYGYEEEAYNLPDISGDGVVVPEGSLKIISIDANQIEAESSDGAVISLDKEALRSLCKEVPEEISVDQTLQIDDMVAHYFLTSEERVRLLTMFMDGIEDFNGIYESQGFENRILPQLEEVL